MVSNLSKRCGVGLGPVYDWYEDVSHQSLIGIGVDVHLAVKSQLPKQKLNHNKIKKGHRPGASVLCVSSDVGVFAPKYRFQKCENT